MQNLRYGAGVSALFVLILGLLIFPSGPFIRPHPLMWRFAFGIGVIYEIWLIVMIFLTKDQARESMKFFDASLGKAIEERSYAADCSFTWANVSGNLDRFVISHFIGWVVKALILRSVASCSSFSVV
jgi:phosphatidylserine synthase 2